MAKPATTARLEASAKGFTQVIKRGDNHIVTRDPTTGKCCYDGQVGGGGWHYGDGQETDTAWQAGVAPWNYQMVKAGYNLFALSNLANGQVIKWLDPVSGQSVAFQPMALQWTNALNQIQQISMPQSVAAQVDDDTLYWPDGYGAGRHFKYIASPSRLNKLLIIDSAASLPSTSYDTLELNFIMGMSSGVTAYVDSGSGLAAWDKKTQKDIVKAIEFRLSNGTVVWSFAVPTAYDSADRSTAGTMRLKKQGRKLYVSVRFPKSWIDTAVFPIVIDPTVDYQVGASGDDGYASGSGFEGSYSKLSFGQLYGTYIHAFVRFAVTIPVGATITNAYLSFVHNATFGSPTGKIHIEEASDPAAVTSWSDLNARSWSTEYVSIVDLYADNKWHNTPDISGLVQGVVDAYDFSSGAHMQFKIHGDGAGGYHAQDLLSWDYSDNTKAPKLHIEYTEAAAGNPHYAYAQQ